VQLRSGIPRIRDLSIDATGRFVPFEALSIVVKLQRVAAFPVRLFFTEDDFTNDVNFWEVAVGETFNCPLEDRGVWVKGVGGTSTSTLLVTHRKG